VIDDVAGTCATAPARGRTWVLPFEVILGGGTPLDSAVAVALNRSISSCGSRMVCSRSIAAMVTCFASPQSQSRPRSSSRIQQVVLANLRGSGEQVGINLGEHGSQKCQSFVRASRSLGCQRVALNATLQAERLYLSD
jgi:hypothetical protein